MGGIDRVARSISAVLHERLPWQRKKYVLFTAGSWKQAWMAPGLELSLTTCGATQPK